MVFYKVGNDFFLEKDNLGKEAQFEVIDALHRKEILDIKNKCLDLQTEINKVLKKDSLYGWLSSQGEFFGCDYLFHFRLAFLKFDCLSEVEMERKGFIKIFPVYKDKRPHAFYYRATSLQEDYLESNNVITDYYSFGGCYAPEE